MTCNVGRIERIVQGIVGVLILGLYGALTPPWQYLTLIGLIPLGSALTGFCPVYAWFGWNRCRPPAHRRNADCRPGCFPSGGRERGAAPDRATRDSRAVASGSPKATGLRSAPGGRDSLSLESGTISQHHRISSI